MRTHNGSVQGFLRCRGPRSALGAAIAVACLLLVLAAPAAALQTYQYVGQFGSAGTGQGQFDWPYFMSFSSGTTQHLYVADTHNARVVELQSDGTWVGQLAAPVWSPDTTGFDQPQGVACGAGTVFVVDYTYGLAAFNATTGAFEAAVTTFHDGDHFNLPIGVAADGEGGVYVADTNDQRVVKFSFLGSPATLTYVTEFDGSTDLKLMSPTGVAVGTKGQVYVADQARGQVVRFAPDAAGTHYTATAFWGGSGSTGVLDGPTGIACDASGNVYVTDPQDQVVKKLNGTDGSLLASWGASGSGNGQFTYPLGIAVAANGHVFVGDREADRIQEFEPVDMGPVTYAFANVTVKKGKSATFKFKVDEDVSPTSATSIVIAKAGVTKATIDCGAVASGVWTTKAWKCTLAKGAYTWSVLATDQGGHAQQDPPGSKTLTVK